LYAVLGFFHPATWRWLNEGEITVVFGLVLILMLCFWKLEPFMLLSLF
jgi:hypothetical protein